nr:lantibiotic dehydratase family protein [Streptomyces sp. NBC_00857]
MGDISQRPLTLCKPFVLRMAGFPFSWIRDTSHRSAVPYAQAVLASQSDRDLQLQKMQSPDVLDLARTKDDGHALRAARSGNYTPAKSPQVSRAVAEIVEGLAKASARTTALSERYDQDYAHALQEARLQVVRRFQDDQALRDILFVLNPGSFKLWEKWLNGLASDPEQWNKKDRAKTDTLTLYLQRACAKNDTTGHVGPFALGQFDRDLPGVAGRPTPQRRTAFVSRWAAESILAHLREHDRSMELAVPRRAPGVAIRQDHVENVEYDYWDRTDSVVKAVGRLRRFETLSPGQLRVLETCDGVRDLDALCAHISVTPGAGMPGSRGDVVEILRQLKDLGLVITGPEIPYGVESALDLLHVVAGHTKDTAVLDLIANLHEALEQLPNASTAQRVHLVDAVDAQFHQALASDRSHRGGQFYGDRTLLFEESEGRLADLRLGREATARIERQLPLITDAYLFLPRHRLHMEHVVVKDWFRTRFPGGTASVNDYLVAFATDQHVLTPAFSAVEDDIERLQERLQGAAVAAIAAGASAGPSSTDLLRTFIAEHSIDLPAVCNVDLMVSATPDAEGLIEPVSSVVSEVHADEECLTHGIFGPFIVRDLPGFPADVVAGYESLLAPGQIVMNASLYHRNKGFIRRELPCPEIEAFDRSTAPPSLRRRMDDLVVQLRGDELCLVEQATGMIVKLISLPFSSLGLPNNPMHVFGFPQRQTGNLFSPRAGEPLPRLEFDDLILSRAVWPVDPGRIRHKDAQRGFLLVQRLRSELGLPRHVFARVPEETKPIYVDLDSPLLVRQLSRLAGRASLLLLSEMQPTPEQLWLRVQGESFTSELRFAVFDPASPATSVVTPEKS